MILSAFGKRPASRIDSKLWQGGFPQDPTQLTLFGFDAIVLCARELQPAGTDVEDLFPDIALFCAPMDDDIDDGPTRAEISIALNARDFILRQLNQGKRVLTSCVAGRNRSGLVNALVLMSRHKINGKEAAKWVQDMRANALTNSSFETFLHRLPAPF